MAGKQGKGERTEWKCQDCDLKWKKFSSKITDHYKEFPEHRKPEGWKPPVKKDPKPPAVEQPTLFTAQQQAETLVSKLTTEIADLTTRINSVNNLKQQRTELNEQRDGLLKLFKIELPKPPATA